MLEASGIALARHIKSGELSAREVLEAHLDRIERVNGVINAVVWKRYAAARAEADAVDAAVARGEAEGLPIYAGVPCTVKECFAFAGQPQTSGMVSRRGALASEDATAVARLRATGAIVMGGTNVSELCMWMESDNRVYGRTNNPYDPSRIVGGSSGGEGAIIGAGASPFGLGSDIGGSIRMPAFFNGVFGHKPSGGAVPNTGQYPLGENEALRYCTTGPLARRAEDLWPLLTAMAGPDGRDAYAEAMPFGDPASVDVSQLHVIDVPDNGLVPVHPELRAAQVRVRDALAARGARVTERRFEGFDDAVSIWSSMIQAAGGKSFSDMLLVAGETLGREWLAALAGRSDHTMPALALAALERVGPKLPSMAREAILEGLALRRTLEEALGDDGVMLFPVYAEPAPPHRKPWWPPFMLQLPRGGVPARINATWGYTCILNVMQVPSTAVPLGLSDEGLPLGVQVAARWGNDHLTIAVAGALEEAFGGWVSPWEAGPHAVR